jgi:hypothetical protein
MLHPTNRRERFLIGKHLGEKRASMLYSYLERKKHPEWFEKGAQRLRNTTKLCGRPCCSNPRHNGWNNGIHGLTMQEIKFNEAVKDQ